MTIIRKMKKSIFSVHSLFAGLLALPIVALTLFAFASCDAGLGESIDTTEPKVTITGPDSGAVLCTPFNITGTCVDDKAVASVAITIKDTATDQIVKNESATINGNNWTLQVSSLADGTYSASAICYDAAGRKSGVASRVFDVDNTPPVFCVTKPNSLSIADPAAYGRDVTIKGEIADDHAVKQMDIRVFKFQGGAATEITNTLSKTTFSGFETAGGTEITIAKFFPDAEIPAANSDDYPLYQNYKAMYTDLGASVGDTVQLYIFPYLTDAAGNKSDKCYIQNSLKQLVSKACSVDTTSDSLQTAQLKKILNGSYSLGEINVDTMKTILGGQYNQSAIGTNYLYYAHLPEGESAVSASNAPLAMSLNANNSPMYEFGTFDVDRDNLAFKEVNNDGTMTVKVSAGLDGNEIIANTVRVYLWECDDKLRLKDGLNINDVSTASYSSDNSDPAKAFKVLSDQTEVKDFESTVRVSTATYKVLLPSTMSAGVHYILTAGGEDVAGNKFYSSATYAFMVATTGDAPKVEFGDQFFINAKAIDANQTDAYKAKIQITDKTGSATSPAGSGTMQETGSWLRVRLSLYKGYAKTKGYLSDNNLLQKLGEIKYEGAQIQNPNPGSGEYYVEVPVNKFVLTGANKADNYTVALEVQAKNIGATSESTTYIFWADAAAPALEIAAPKRESGASESLPLYIFETDKNITDTTPQGATAKTYEYSQSGTWSDIGGSGTSELWYVWEDASNIAAAPSLTWSAASGTAKEGFTYYTKQGEGLYLAETGIALGASVSGLYTLSVGTVWKPIKSAPKSVSRANWNEGGVSVTNSSGKTLKVVAVDQTGNLSAVAAVPNIMFDFAPPVITVLAVDEYYKAVQQFTVTAEDVSGVGKDNVTVTATKDGQPAASGWTLDKTQTDSNTVTVTIKATIDGKWSFETTAKDGANRTSSKAFGFTIDTVAPERVNHYVDSSTDRTKDRMITVGTNSSEGVEYWHNSENLTIKGKFKENTSGLDKVVYTVTPPAEGSTPATSVDGSEAIGGAKGDVEYSLSPVGFKEGVNKIAITGYDLAGNLSSSSETYTIQIDTTAPLVNTAWYTYAQTPTAEDLTEAAGTAMSNGSLSMTVYGTLEEKLSGIKGVDLVMNGNVVSSGVQYTQSALSSKADYLKDVWENYSAVNNKVYTGFKAVIPADKLAAVTSGDVELYAVATDMAGNKTEQRKFSIHLDKDKPVINNMSPDASGSVNGKITFTGAVDDPALKAVKAYWSADGTTYQEILDDANPPKPILAGTYSWNIKNLALNSVSSDKIIFFDGTEYAGTTKDFYLKILATDKAGNQEIQVKKYTVDPNADRPKITLTTAELDGMSSAKYAPYDSQKIEGTVEDDDGVTKFEYSTDSGASWTDITSSISGGAWSISVAQDGPYAIKFRVTDKAGTVFTSTKTGETGATNIYISPTIAGKDKTFSTGDTNLYLLVDTKRPEFESLVYRTSASASGTYEPAAGVDKLGVVGGSKKFVKLSFDAKDENGIGSVKLTLNGTPFTGTVGAKNAATGKYPCEISGIDVSALASDVYSAKLEITGGFAGDVTTETIAFTVDNTPPDVKMLSPDENSVHGAVTAYGTVDGSNSMKYVLSLTGTGTVAPADAVYADIKGVGNTWFVYFDGDTSFVGEESHADTFEKFIIAKGITTEEAIRNQTFTTIVPIYIWIKAVDDVGNVYEKAHLINFDPQGGRPTVTFGNPEDNETRVGGEVKLYGGADCEEGEIKAVFLQIISAQHKKIGDVDYSTETWSWGTATYSGGKVTAFAPSANDLDYLKAAGYKVYKMRDYPTTVTEWNGSGTPSDYGVLADFKGSAWNLRINGSGEFNPTTGTNQLVVCAYAWNGRKMNLPYYRQMYVDADSPIIDNMFLKQYESSAVKTSRAYTSGMYVRKANSLEFDLKDQDKIAKVYLGQSDQSAEKAREQATQNKASDNCYAAPGTKTYHAKIDLDTGTGVGSKYLYVIFLDQKGNQGNQAFAINYDNKAPDVYVEPSATSKGISGDVHNTDGFYSVEGKVTENADDGKNQSGFERFVVYFKRGNKIYDPMISKDADSGVDVTAHGISLGDDGLYWLKQTVTRDTANLNNIVLPEQNIHIHEGRLVKMGGVIYKIKSVGTDKKTITLSDNVEIGFTDAYFAYGNSIDNNKKETGSGGNSTASGYGYGYPTNISNEDGDGMVEWANIQGTVCNLSASINSKNIPDGSIEICWTAFDKAGNFTKGSVTTYTASDGKTKPAYVSNNAPRLANVIVASDYNYDSTYSAEESRAYYGGYEDASLKPADWENAKASLTLGSTTLPFIAAKGAVKVTPEILGGNGALTWTCKYAGSAAATTAEALSASTTEENQKRTLTNDIMLAKDKLKAATAGKGKYEITINDSTDGGAQSATINLYMKNDVNDTEKPMAKTKRFYWNGLNDNSVYGSDDTSKVKNQLDLQGHIELPQTWVTGTGTSAVTHTYATPKVSGKIVIKGTAFDNAGIASINLTIPGITVTNPVASCDFTKTDTRARWTQNAGDLGTNGYHFALDTDSSGAIKERYTNTGHFVSWTLELDTQKYGGGTAPAAGNVNFVIGIKDKRDSGDTAMDSPTAENSSITVYATAAQAAKGKYYSEERFAAADKTSAFSAADYTADEFSYIGAATVITGSSVKKYTATPVDANYKMDIVPYITKVVTKLSENNATNGVTDRSSLGAYPIYVYKNSTATAADVSAKTPDETETVKIYGFNLAGSMYGSGDSAIACGNERADGGYVTLTSDKIAKGAFDLNVNSQSTLNNSNNNEAKGSYTHGSTIADNEKHDVYLNYINRQPNGANNNELTDDIAFDVWELNSKAAIPMSGSVNDPQMRIQAITESGTGGKIGFAFSNGSNAFSMPNDTYSWSYWAYDYVGAQHTALAYDPAGKVWAAAAGKDTSEDGGDSFFLESSRWRQHGGGNKYGSTATSGTNLNHDMTKLAICKLERLAVTTDGTWVSQNRVQSPSIAATKKGLYMAYYDGFNKTIRYRAGDYSQGYTTWNPTSDIWSSGNPGTIPVIKFNSGFFADEATAHSTMPYSEANVQIVAGKSSITDPERGNAAPNVCIAAKDGGDTRSDDVVVMVWHDGSKIMYSYTTGDPMATDASDSSKLKAVWSTPEPIFGSDVVGKGCQCAVAVDAKGGVHIAAYDSNDMDLWYAYLPSPSDLTNKKTARVDSYESTGEYITIDVALDASDNPLPQIGFYSATSLHPKFARWNTKKGSIKTAGDINGTDENDSYTGNWEVTNVPTKSDVRTTDSINGVKQNINVAVWKTATNGRLAASTTGNSFCIANNPGINATNYGDVYGNGSKNAVLGYMWGSHSAAFIETAQRVGDYGD